MALSNITVNNTSIVGVDVSPIAGSRNLIESGAVYAVDNDLEDFKETVRTQFDEYSPIEITGNVTNAPDEEDITSVSQSGTNVLKLKNRNNLNGMGYVILRRGSSFASQLTLTNTIYVIRYDFTLTADVTIPANCILQFEGGSLTGAYTLTGQNTCIISPLEKIFNTNIIIAGSWNIKESYPEWFGAKGDGVTNDTTAIQKTIDSFYRIFFSYKTYICSCSNNVGLTISDPKIICGNQWASYSENGNEHSIKFINVTDGDVCIWIYTDQVKFQDIQIKCDGDTKLGIGLRHSRPEGQIAHGLTLEHVKFIGFNIGAQLKSFLNLLTKAYFSKCSLGTEVVAATNAYPTSNSFRECYWDQNDNGLKISGVYHSLLNCCFDVTAGTALHVTNTCERILCLQTSFESNKQAIKNEGGYSKFINCYFLDNTSMWSSYEEAANYIWFKGDCGVLDNIFLQINDSAGSDVRLGSNFKCIYAVANNDNHPSLTIEGFFMWFSYIKSDNINYCVIKDPLWNNFRTHDTITDRLTNQARVEFYDVGLKKPLWWDGSIWRDAMGNNADNMPAEKVKDVGNRDATYWNGICGSHYAGTVVTGYHTGLNCGIVTIGTSDYTLLIVNGYNSGLLQTRTYYSDSQQWTSWRTIQFT